MTPKLDSENASQHYYFDSSVAGIRVQADGGNAAIGSRLASRETFEGELTGWRMDEGNPPWKWFEIGALVDKPPGFSAESVWCEETYIYRIYNKSQEVS
jgi:hypothetical protein